MPHIFAMNALILLVVAFVAGCTYLEDSVLLALRAPKTLAPERLTVATWNVAKGAVAKSSSTTSRELNRLLGKSDISCIQEFVPSLAPQVGGVFARSFRWWLGGEPTGVATLSRAQPQTSMALAAPWREGWFVTPKMSLITTYALGPATLMVVDLHALNFQPIFVYMLADQMAQITQHVDDHDGPVIVCGDFNTWRNDRLAVVESALHEFDQVSFPPNTLTGGGAVARLFGGDEALALDRIFVRGLEIIAAEVGATRSSDHNVALVRLRFKP